VIEAGMFVALGFCVAALMALAVLPAIARRADRLARRRAEAAFPLSLEQVAAERDHLRAELALRERAMEKRVEAAAATAAGSRGETGRRDVEIAALGRDIDARKAEIGSLTQALRLMTDDRDGTAQRLAAEQGELVVRSTELAKAQEDAAKESARLESLLHERNEAIGLVNRQREALEQDLAGLRAEKAAVEDQLKTAQATLGSLGQERDRLRMTLAAEQKALAAEQKALASEQRALALAGEAAKALEQQLATARTEKAAMDVRLEGQVSATGAARAERDNLAQALELQKGKTAAKADAFRELEQAFMARGRELDEERKLAATRSDERDGVRTDLVDLRRAHDLMARDLAEGERRLQRLQSELVRDQTALGEKLRRTEDRLATTAVARQSAEQNLLTLREERARLRQETTALKREITRLEAQAKGDNASLRREIMAVAETMVGPSHPAARKLSITDPEPEDNGRTGKPANPHASAAVREGNVIQGANLVQGAGVIQEASVIQGASARAASAPAQAKARKAAAS
jgi:hypothetical protein